MKWPDLTRIDGYLPPDIEKDYRLHYLKDDTRTAGITMFLLSLLLLAFAYNDYQLLGTAPTFYWLIALRSSFLIYFIILIIYLRKNRSPQKFDILLLVWIILSLVLVSVINLTRPSSYAGNFILDVILVLLVYLCIPTKLYFRMTGALIFTVIEIIIFFVLREISSQVTAFSAIISLIAANIGGTFASGLLYSHRRSEYKTLIERETLVDQWQTTFDSISDMISIQDKEFRIIRANKAYIDTFKIKPGDMAGKHCYEIFHETSYAIDNCPHSQVLVSGKPAVEEIFEPRLGIYLEVSTYPILNSQGEVTGTVHLAKDITERKRMQHELEEISTHDFLTGLPNRLLLNDRFSVAIAQAQRHKERIALMSLDLDRFKLINDTMGHAAGDEILKLLADRLLAATRAGDTVARMGGDEFQVLMQDILHEDEIIKVADRILNLCSQPFNLDGEEINTSVSIGIVLGPDEGTDLETLSKKSDQAMYESKGKGRNCYTFYQPDSPS
ncbi:MAG: GGDEF domain-containing protein [Dehalococcoidia bacterium]|nr:GGDEF domain-containing protein [Dehalococcoidia bacterium]